jgi:3,4-dihydroxy 2-butanone 4-phosphate synthase/GTP cyclohydrolase II
VVPLRARPGGVLQRATLIEAAVDVADGASSLGEDLFAFAREHDLKVVTIGQVIEVRRRGEKLVERASSVRLPTAYGEFTVVAFVDKLTGEQHVALVKGDVAGARDVLVRVHSDCFFGDVLGSRACSCGELVSGALRAIEREGTGVVVYLTHESRGAEVCSRLAEREQGAAESEFGIGAQILADLGLTSIRILTSDPKTLPGIEGFGLEVTDQVLLEVPDAAGRAAG